MDETPSVSVLHVLLVLLAIVLMAALLAWVLPVGDGDDAGPPESHFAVQPVLPEPPPVFT